MRLLLLAAAWIGGVWLGLETDFRPAAIYVLLAACLTLGLCLFLLQWRLFPVAVVALLLLGAWRAGSIEFPAQPLTTADQQQALVIESLPPIRARVAGRSGLSWKYPPSTGTTATRRHPGVCWSTRPHRQSWRPAGRHRTSGTATL